MSAGGPVPRGQGEGGQAHQAGEWLGLARHDCRAGLAGRLLQAGCSGRVVWRSRPSACCLAQVVSLGKEKQELEKAHAQVGSWSMWARRQAGPGSSHRRRQPPACRDAAETSAPAKRVLMVLRRRSSSSGRPG